MEEKKGYTRVALWIFMAAPLLLPKLANGKLVPSLLLTTSSYEAFERMAFYGIASNLVNYLTSQLHEDTISSVRNANNWSGSVRITPLLGAYIADTYMGRFWTFTVSSLIYVVGVCSVRITELRRVGWVNETVLKQKNKEKPAV